jgi:hypothetical protein
MARVSTVGSLVLAALAAAVITVGPSPVEAAQNRIMDVPGWKGCADPPQSIKGKCNKHVGGHCNPRTGLWVVVGIAAQKAASDCAGRGGPGR